MNQHLLLLYLPWFLCLFLSRTRKERKKEKKFNALVSSSGGLNSGRFGTRKRREIEIESVNENTRVIKMSIGIAAINDIFVLSLLLFSWVTFFYSVLSAPILQHHLERIHTCKSVFLCVRVYIDISCW